MGSGKRLALVGALMLGLLMVLAVGPSSAQEAFVGEIRMVGFNFAPQGWLACEGQELPIARYQALYALLGTTFGGDGRTNFKLPDLRVRLKTPAPAPGETTAATPAPAPQPQTGLWVGDKVVPIRFIIATEGLFPPRP